MKKKLLFTFVGAVMVSFAAYSSLQSNEEVSLSDMAMENVEALASVDPVINPECPNGCLTDPGSCKCNGPHPFIEAIWP